ncbi:alpha/beta hydrolase [Emticicia sp.]|uniref:alpha/beta hydrolase n=1 Tax=Emticicia sp. TaxID=1930953 RepID=UPI003750ABA3
MFKLKYLQIAITIYVVLILTLILFQRFILLHPKKLAKDYHFDFPKSEEFYVQITSDIKINSLRFSTTDSVSKGAVLYFHGNADNLARWGEHATQFTERGYDVVMYDYRGFGKSNGRFDEKNFLNDAQYIFDDLSRRYNPDKIILYGRSLGCGAAIKVASENPVKKLILETPYYSLPDVAWSHLPIFPFKYVSEFKVPAHQWLPKVHCDIHVFHGTDDEVVPYNQSIKLLTTTNRNPDKTLTTLQGGHHRDLEKFKEYQAKMDELLK